MEDLLFVNPLFRELERLQRDFGQFYAGASSVRAGLPGSFPAINVGSTDQSIEIVAFVPGVDVKKIELTVDKGTLTLSGARSSLQGDSEAKAHSLERFTGQFQRVIELPENADSAKVEAHYTDGCLVIKVAKKESSAPKQISIQ